MTFTERQPKEIGLRLRVVVPLLSLSILFGAALLSTVGSRNPLPLPQTVSLAVSADGYVSETITQNQPFAFFILEDPHKGLGINVAIVIKQGRSYPTERLAGALQEELARSYPEHVLKILPDGSSATELVADPSLFAPHTLPNGVLSWKTKAETIFLIKDGDYFVITDDPTIIFNRSTRNALTRFAKGRPRSCQVYMQSVAKRSFPPKLPPTILPTASRLIKWGAEHIKQGRSHCIVWG